MKTKHVLIILGWLLQGIALVSCSPGHHVSHSPSPDSGKRLGIFPSSLSADSLFVEAQKEKLIGNANNAIVLFHEFLKLKPGNATACYELSRLYAQLKKAPLALANARMAVSGDPTNHWYAIAYAEALALNKKFDSAAMVFHQLAEDDTTNDEYSFNEGVLLASAGQYPEALKIFNTLENKTGLSEELVYQKQRVYLKMGDVPSATHEIRRLIAENPDNARYYGLLAQVYEESHQLDQAIAVYQELLHKSPENPQAMVALGLYYKKKGNDTVFHQYMAKAFGNPRFDIDDKIAFVYPFLKYVQIDSTEQPEALTLCRLIVDAHPDDSRAHALSGDMFFQCRMNDSALIEYQKSLQLDDSRYEVWRQVMLIYIAKQNNDSLLQISKKVVNLFPEEMTAWYFRGMASIFAGDTRAGTTSLRHALQLEGGGAELRGRIYGTLGEAYHTLGQYVSSDSSFEKALQLDPEDDLLLNNYSYYLSKRNKKLDQALEMIKKAVTLKPGQYTYEDTYAGILFRMGKFKQARQWMEKALRHPEAKQRPGYLEHYGDILYKLHDVDKAVKYWKLAKDKGGISDQLERKIRDKKYTSGRRIR